MRALEETFSSTEKILELFHDVVDIKVENLTPEHYSAEQVVNEEGEEICRIGAPIGDAIDAIQSSSIKKLRVVQDPGDPLILNTLAMERLDFDANSTEHEAALLRIYGRLRPGNPPQIDKAKALFKEKFFDENRYRLGKVGRFRINRKFDMDISEDVMHIRAEDFLAVIRYMLDLRAKRNKAHIDDIDHLGNRRLRTLDELAVEEMRKGFLKLRRTVQERMSVKDPSELSKIADLVNSKSIKVPPSTSSSVEANSHRWSTRRTHFPCLCTREGSPHWAPADSTASEPASRYATSTSRTTDESARLRRPKAPTSVSSPRLASMPRSTSTASF